MPVLNKITNYFRPVQTHGNLDAGAQSESPVSHISAAASEAANGLRGRINGGRPKPPTAPAEGGKAEGKSSAVDVGAETPTQPPTRNGSLVSQQPTQDLHSQSQAPVSKSEYRPRNESFAQESPAAKTPRQPKIISPGEEKATEIASRKNLVPNNYAMQKILTNILEVMRSGKNASSLSREHAAVLKHLEAQLKPKPSEVPGVSLTGFSHVRYFDTVMPHDFVHIKTEDLEIQIIADSLAHAEHPTSPVPPNVFTLEQFQNIKEPVKDPEILPPEHAVQGQDCRANRIVGLHAGHADMIALNEQYKDSQKTSISLGEDINSWQDTAWMAALMNLSPNELKNDLEDEKKGVPEDRKEHIAKIQTAAKALQAARLNAAELKKKGDLDNANMYLEKASNDALKAIRRHARPLTRAVLNSTRKPGGYRVENQSVRDQACMMSLMSALGVPAITIRGRNAKGGPAIMTYHAADMTHAEEAFSSAEGHKKKEFLAKEMQSVPFVEIGEKGFTLTFPEASVELKDVKSHDDMPEPKGENSLQGPSAANEHESTGDDLKGRP